MLTKKEAILEDEDCAAMLGVSVEKYRESLNNIKAPTEENINGKKVEYDNSLLNFLGIKESDLKRKNIPCDKMEGIGEEKSKYRRYLDNNSSEIIS